MLLRWGKTRRGELADAGGAGTAAGTHGVVAQRRSRLLAPLSHELGDVVATRALRESPRCSKRISGNQIGSYFCFAHVKMFHVALQLLQKNLESELY